MLLAPYYEILANEDVIQKVVNENLRLKQPSNCPNSIYQLMTQVIFFFFYFSIIIKFSVGIVNHLRDLHF